MKKTPLMVKGVAFLVFITVVFVFSQNTLACLFPSPLKMSEGKSMACCEEHCRMDTTPQAAKQKCDQSLFVFSQHPVLSGSVTFGFNFYLDNLSDLGQLLHTESISGESTYRSISPIEIDPTKYNQPVKLYIITRSLLI